MIRKERKNLLAELIQGSPGIQFSELMRQTGMKNGVLSHYARKLEKKGTVIVERTPRVTRYYPQDFNKEEIFLAKNLRRETPRHIIAVLRNNQLTFSEIANKVNRSRPTVSLCLTKLIEDHVIECKIVNIKRVFQIKNPDLAHKMMLNCYPDIIEKTADRIGDIFSSL